MPIVSLSTYSLFLEMGYHQAMEFAIEHGFQGIEIWSNLFDFWPKTVEAKERETIRSMAKENRLTLAIHFCDGNNLSDMNKGHLKESRKQLKETIRLCHEIEGRVVIFHPGIGPHLSIHDKDPLSQYPRFTSSNLKKEAVRRFKESLTDVTPYAEQYGIVIGLENFAHVKHCIQTTFDELVEWVDEIGSPSLQITLDIGHANLEGGVEKAINVFGARIKHVHMNDNSGIKSEHGELGTGTINWQAVVSFLKSFQGMLSIEVLGFKDVKGTVLRSKTFLENLLKGS